MDSYIAATFGFWQGAAIVDVSGLLETLGKVMAHVKLRAVADVDGQLLADWLRQARNLTIKKAPRAAE